jgi:hypothetical protein
MGLGTLILLFIFLMVVWFIYYVWHKCTRGTAGNYGLLGGACRLILGGNN